MNSGAVSPFFLLLRLKKNTKGPRCSPNLWPPAYGGPTAGLRHMDTKTSKWLRYGPQDTSSRLIVARALAKSLSPLTPQGEIPDALLPQVLSLRRDYCSLVNGYIKARGMPWSGDNQSYIRQASMLVLENTLIAFMAGLPQPALVFWAPGFGDFSVRVRRLEEANGALYASLIEVLKV